MNKLLSIFLIGLCLFAAIVPTARADRGENEDADEHDRDVQFETQDSSKIEVSSFDSVLGNEIKFRAETTSDGLYIEVEFHSEPVDTEDSASSSAKEGGSGSDEDSGSSGEDSNGGSDSNSDEDSGNEGGDSGSDDSGEDDNSNHVEVKFRAVFESVVAYNETNGTPGYQAGEETSIVDLSAINWDSFACASSTDDAGANVISCSAQTSDLSFGIVAHIVDQPTNVSGVDVKPTGVKIDVYFAKSSSDYLAVVVGFKSDSNDDGKDDQMEVDDDSEDKQTGSSEAAVNFADFGFFSWVTSATINGQTVNVLNSDLAGNSNNGLQEVVFSFETSEVGQLYWDPVLSVKGTDKLTSGAASFLPSVFLLAALAFLAL